MPIPQTYLVGPYGHAYWLEPAPDVFGDPSDELWACPLLPDGRPDFASGFDATVFHTDIAADFTAAAYDRLTKVLRMADRIEAERPTATPAAA